MNYEEAKDRRIEELEDVLDRVIKYYMPKEGSGIDSRMVDEILVEACLVLLRPERA